MEKMSREDKMMASAKEKLLKEEIKLEGKTMKEAAFDPDHGCGNEPHLPKNPQPRPGIKDPYPCGTEPHKPPRGPKVPQRPKKK